MLVEPEPKPETSALAAPSGAKNGTADQFEEWRDRVFARTGDEERPDQMQGWALIMRSPYQSWDGATSWLGGVPSGPEGFVWPSGESGKRLHFLAQIDLGALKGHSDDRCGRSGLPRSGALLVFSSFTEYAVVTLTEADMHLSAPIAIPDDLPPVREIGAWHDAPTFPQWPVDARAILDNGQYGSVFMSGYFCDPTQWISTWAVARIDADLVLNEIETIRRSVAKRRRARLAPKAISKALGVRLLSYRNAVLTTLRLQPRPSATALPASTAQQVRAEKRREAMAMLERIVHHKQFRVPHRTLIRFRNIAAKLAPAAQVNMEVLKNGIGMRRDLAKMMPQGFMLPNVLRGTPHLVWEQIQRDYRLDGSRESFALVPPGLRPFVEAVITEWRGHSLFGRAVLDPFINEEDRRGQDLLLGVFSDELLKTRMEHHHAITIWCDRDKMAEGNYTNGQVIYFHNG